MNNSDDFMGFCLKYKGAIIGGLVTIVIVCTGFYKLLIALALIVLGIWLGNYVQKNKDKVKEKLKNFIDRF